MNIINCAHGQEHMIHGRSRVLARAGTSSPVFTDDDDDDGTHDRGGRMNSDVYRNIPSANLQGNASSVIGRKIIMQRAFAPHSSFALIFLAAVCLLQKHCIPFLCLMNSVTTTCLFLSLTSLILKVPPLRFCITRNKKRKREQMKAAVQKGDDGV